MADVLDEVAAVADAVLFEGYLLYPYRASAQKNRLRWQFGVLTPEYDGTEPTRSRTEVLLEPKPGCTLRIRLRFLQLQARTPLVDDPRYTPFGGGGPRHRRSPPPAGGGVGHCAGGCSSRPSTCQGPTSCTGCGWTSSTTGCARRGRRATRGCARRWSPGTPSSPPSRAPGSR